MTENTNKNVIILKPIDKNIKMFWRSLLPKGIDCVTLFSFLMPYDAGRNPAWDLLLLFRGGHIQDKGYRTTLPKPERSNRKKL